MIGGGGSKNRSLGKYLTSLFDHVAVVRYRIDSAHTYILLGSLVWSKLQGYPWWPSLVCDHPTEKRSFRKQELHVQFFDDPITRAWVNIDLIKPFNEKVGRGEGADKTWDKGLKDAEKVAELSNEERLDLLLVQHLPSDDEWEVNFRFYKDKFRT